ncbi:MAG TPA: type II toxin-antitoxin system VapB family antitoxin [Caulobacter sp.]|nr:type II toxin-antitoxin system VapB family antitoxin [Caulobacter sp.]
MGISIKRADTEDLVRRVATATGESLTETIHQAVAERAARLEPDGAARARRKAELAAFFAELDARPRTGRTREEIEAEMYGEFGEPI